MPLQIYLSVRVINNYAATVESFCMFYLLFYTSSNNIALYKNYFIMVTKVTQGIKISVDVRYLEEFSNPLKNQFLFAYHILIENESEYTYQLLRRNWNIFDSNGEYKLIEGEGVIGEQPVINPKQFFEYESSCRLQTDFGTMQGSYEMLRTIDNTTVIVHIPEFQLITPQKLN
jgi:ApaG protein